MNKADKKINVMCLHNIHEISGGERSLINLWENLNRDRFQPFLVLPQQGALSDEARRLGLHVSYLTVPQLRPINVLKMIRVCFYLARYIRKHNIHIIHSYTPRNNILSAIVGRILNVPVIWHERNLIFGDEWDTTRKFLPLPARVICNSQSVARRFLSNGRIPDKVKVIINGVNLERYQAVSDHDPFKKKLDLGSEKIVGIVTNLTKRKRIDFFLEVAAQVHKRCDDVKFLVVGGEFPDEGGKRLREFQEMAGRLGLEDKIIFTGFQDDVSPFLYAFDLFVHVAVQEACSRAILEAMACGLPVVTVNEGGNPELVKDGETGILFAAGDRDGFVLAIVELLNDDQRRAAMGRNSRRRVEQLFDIKRNTRETEALYEELVDKNTG